MTKKRLNKFDCVIAPAAALLAAMWTFPRISSPVEWDDLLYMNVSQHTTEEAWILNRYCHIYLQKFFFFISGGAITGAKVYWCFLFFATLVLVYFSAKLLSRSKGTMIGIIAVLFYLAQPLFTWNAGCVYADFTVMFLFMLAVFIYTAFPFNKSQNRRWILMLLGLIFFWAIKSKETGACIAVLFLGFGIDGSGRFSFDRFAKDIGWVLAGASAGYCLLMILDAVFLGDPFFSLRLGNLKRLMTFYYKHPVGPNKRPIRSWYMYLSTTPLFAPFVLYLVGGNRFRIRREKFIWLLPLFTLFFLSFILGRWHIVPRYFIPTIPVTCVLAARFFNFKINIRTSLVKKLTVSGLTIIPFFIVWVFMSYADDITRFFYLPSVDSFYSLGIMVFALTVLLMTASALNKRGPVAVFTASFCLFLLIYQPISTGIASLKNRAVARRVEMRFEPYRVFKDQLRIDNDVIILVSKNIYKRSGMLGREIRSHCWMFNIFFNENLYYENFIDGNMEDILKANYDYAFLTYDDWQTIGKKNEKQNLLARYTVLSDRRTDTVFLKEKVRL